MRFGVTVLLLCLYFQSQSANAEGRRIPYPGGAEVECAVARNVALDMKWNGSMLNPRLLDWGGGGQDVDCRAVFTLAGLPVMTEAELEARDQEMAELAAEGLTSFSRLYRVDRRHAYFIVSTSCGALCGSGARYNLKLEKDGWHIKSRKLAFQV